MQSAPVILLAELVSATPVSEIEDVQKPAGVGGPIAPTIPMGLMRIWARVLAPLRGAETSAVEFYSWIFAGGKHGGPRLFHPSPGSVHIIFLRQALRASNWPLPDVLFGWTRTPERHRMAMRLYASATDLEFQMAACEAASEMPEARDIPEARL